MDKKRFPRTQPKKDTASPNPKENSGCGCCLSQASTPVRPMCVVYMPCYYCDSVFAEEEDHASYIQHLRDSHRIMKNERALIKVTMKMQELEELKLRTLASKTNKIEAPRTALVSSTKPRKAVPQFDAKLNFWYTGTPPVVADLAMDTEPRCPKDEYVQSKIVFDPKLNFWYSAKSEQDITAEVKTDKTCCQTSQNPEMDANISKKMECLNKEEQNEQDNMVTGIKPELCKPDIGIEVKKDALKDTFKDKTGSVIRFDSKLNFWFIGNPPVITEYQEHDDKVKIPPIETKPNEKLVFDPKLNFWYSKKSPEQYDVTSEAYAEMIRGKMLKEGKAAFEADQARAQKATNSVYEQMKLKSLNDIKKECEAKHKAQSGKVDSGGDDQTGEADVVNPSRNTKKLINKKTEVKEGVMGQRQLAQIKKEKETNMITEGTEAQHCMDNIRETKNQEANAPPEEAKENEQAALNQNENSYEVQSKSENINEFQNEDLVIAGKDSNIVEKKDNVNASDTENGNKAQTSKKNKNKKK